MIKYHLEIVESAEKELHRHHKTLQDRIISKILKLSDNPRPHGFKKLFGFNSYRIRIGDYRVIYSIDDTRRTVKILAIGHRKDIYR